MSPWSPRLRQYKYQVTTAFTTIVKKDLTEHGWVMLFVTLGVGLSVLLALQQNQILASSISPLQIVHTALITLLPLIAFIMGQRLVVSEYLGRTKLFVESMPVRARTLVAAKFVFGLVFLCLLAILVLAMSAYAAREVDSIDRSYFFLLVLKTTSMMVLIWSLVFCLSFCGFIRIALYIVLLVSVILLSVNPAYDAAQVGPFSLMDRQLFVFERDEYPWSDLLETWGITAFFVATACTLALFDEGSVAQVLAKPMSRRDIVMTGLVVIVVLQLLSKLLEDPEPAAAEVGKHVLRNADPPVSVAYRTERHQAEGQRLLDTVVKALGSLQLAMGTRSVQWLPVRVQQDNTLEAGEVRIDITDDVSVRANFGSNDRFENHTLTTVVLHDVFQNLSNGRLTFEPWHWLLDGITRWWVETRLPISAHRDELLALAVHAGLQLEQHWTLSQHWQLITDRVGYPAAEALAYSAIIYLQQLRDSRSVEQLAQEVLLPARSGSSTTSLKYWLDPAEQRFLRITNLDMMSFFADWRVWLSEQQTQPGVSKRLALVPDIQGQITLSGADSSLRVNLIDKTLQTATGESESSRYRCQLLHESIAPFDHEMLPQLEEKKYLECAVSDYKVTGIYGSGDRVYGVLQLLAEPFHAPLRIWQGRLTIP